MRKRNFCTEVNRVVYVDKEKQTSYCKLDCCINLFPDEDNMVPYALINKLKKKYPCEIKTKDGKVIKQLGLNHAYGDVFYVHVETTATCHSGDTFDEKKGKTIVYSKAQKKLYGLLERVFMDVSEFYVQNLVKARDAHAMFRRYKEREYRFLDSI